VPTSASPAPSPAPVVPPMPAGGVSPQTLLNLNWGADSSPPQPVNDGGYQRAMLSSLIANNSSPYNSLNANP
jgi:hypothetical protein